VPLSSTFQQIYFVDLSKMDQRLLLENDAGERCWRPIVERRSIPTRKATSRESHVWLVVSWNARREHSRESHVAIAISMMG